MIMVHAVGMSGTVLVSHALKKKFGTIYRFKAALCENLNVI